MGKTMQATLRERAGEGVGELSELKLDVEYHLSLWAVLSRQSERVGWYRQQPWYVPAGYRESLPEPSDDDLELADRVGRVVLKMSQREPRRGQIVRMYYGAYPGAEHRAKRERLLFITHELGVPRREIYRELDAAKRVIEGAINYAG